MKYIALTLMLLSFSALADKNSVRYGEIPQDGSSNNECERPSVKGCGPCYKACLQQQQSDRSASKELNSSPAEKKQGRGSAAPI